MRIRAAVGDDAPAMGRVMVAAWLSGHHGQIPEELWRKRVEEWTPEVSGAAWARVLREQEAGEAGRVVGLVMGEQDEQDLSGSTARIPALYVREDRRGQGVGRALLGAVATELAALGFMALHISVLSLNRPARAFYEAMGGLEIGQRTFDEEGVPLPETVYAWPQITTLTESPTQRW